MKSPIPKILLAEDNEINQDVALNILEEVNAEVVIANNGREALERVQEQCFSLILMDLQMPEMDGFKATEHIRAMPEYVNVPIIAMTARAMSGDREKCLEKGMDDYLSKPIKIDVFINTVTRWLKSNNNDDHMTPEVTIIPLSAQAIELIKKIPDIDHEQAIKRFKGNYELIKNLLTHFVAIKSNAVIEIKEHLDADNRDTAKELIHNLKGIAANISATAIEKNMIALEQAIENHEQALIVDLLLQIQSQIDNMKITVEQML